MGDRRVSGGWPDREGARRQRRHARLRAQARSLLTAPTLTELRARRAQECRLVPDRALATLDDAEAFLRDRRLLTLTADCALPSLFGAAHEPPARPGKAGFGSWPRTKWPWGGELATRPGVITAKIHRGKQLFLSPEAALAADPLCREALARAAAGDLGAEAAAIVRHLGAAGPTDLDDLKAELDLEPKALRSARERLEREGAVVSRSITVPIEGAGRAGADAGHRHSSTLLRWDQAHPQRRKLAPGAALDEIVVIGVRAAVVCQEDEPRTWFSWDVPRSTVDRLRGLGRLIRPAAGWVAAA